MGGIALAYAALHDDPAYTSTRNNGYDHFNLFGGYSGVPNYYFENEDFQQKMDKDFNRHRSGKMDIEGLNIIVDFRLFDDLEVDRSFYDDLEEFFSEGGINTMCIEYNENLDSSKMDNREKATNILGEPSIKELVDPENPYSEIDSLYQNLAIQVFLAPWELAGPDGNDKFAGIAVGTRSAIEFGFNREIEFRVAKHEIGHCLGLKHPQEQDNLMNSSASDGSFNSEQWDKIRDQLS